MLCDFPIGDREIREGISGLLSQCLKKLIRVIFDSLDRMTKDLLQALWSRAVGLAIVFVNLIAIAHHGAGKSNQPPANHANIAAMERIAKNPFHCMPVQ
jgi:tRNA(Arg) A34 adenosine deaminase TadA